MAVCLKACFKSYSSGMEGNKVILDPGQCTVDIRSQVTLHDLPKSKHSA